MASFGEKSRVGFTLELFNPEGAARVLAECRRVLVAAGCLAVVALDRRGRATLMTRLYDWAGRLKRPTVRRLET